MQANFEVIIRNNNTSQEEKEVAYLELLRNCITSNNYELLKTYLLNVKDLWADITTARITKIIKKVFDLVPCDTNSLNNMLEVINSLIECYTKENKNLLRVDLECKRIYVLIFLCKYHEALSKIQEIIKDLKKYDDKNNLINLYVYESKAYYQINDFNKAKSSLTSARSLAVSTYCSYELQAQIDLFNGMYLCDEGNYKTATSYFLESLDGFTIDKKYEYASVSIRYLILCKILEGNEIRNSSTEINNILKNKNVARHLSDKIVLLLLEINKACKNRDIKRYFEILNNNEIEDSFIKKHLGLLYDILLENNIKKVIEPYSVIYLDFISKELNLEFSIIETRIRKMILENKINGIIINEDMSLILKDEKISNEHTLKIMKELEKLKKISQINK